MVGCDMPALVYGTLGCNSADTPHTRPVLGVQYLVFRAWYLWCYGKLPKVDYGGATL